MLEDLLRDCTVDVSDGRNSVSGFYVGRHAVLTEVSQLLLVAGNLRVSERTGSDCTEPQVLEFSMLPGLSGIGRPSATFAVSSSRLALVRVEPPGSEAWADLEPGLPQEGDTIFIPARHSPIVGQVSYVREWGGIGDMRFIGLDASGFEARMSGSPILNTRTGRVFGMLLVDVLEDRDAATWLPFMNLGPELVHLMARWQDPSNTARWQAELSHQPNPPSEPPGLLFRLYIPTERLYATEAARLLDLFRQWLTTTRGHGIRQEDYSTAAGHMVEFFADADATEVPDLPEELHSFSGFLALCSTDPEAAVNLLAETAVGRTASIELVERFRREMRLIELQMRYERQRRILSLQQGVEEDLVQHGVDVGSLLTTQLLAMIERLVPAAAAAAPLAQLTSPLPERPTHYNVLINPQFNQQTIAKVEGIVINSVAGNGNLSLQAKEMMELVARFGGHDTAELQSAVYQVEDPTAPAAKRSRSRERLLQFLKQVGNVAKDVGADILTAWLEKKAGL